MVVAVEGPLHDLLRQRVAVREMELGLRRTGTGGGEQDRKRENGGAAHAYRANEPRYS